MHNNKTFLAIIPARGGSKRLPRKNVLELEGKPLIAWSIEAGLKSKYIDKVVVSSDDVQILTLSKDIGATALERPAILATDTSSTFDVVEHSISKYMDYDYIVLLQPTSPLRTVEQLDEAIELLAYKEADAIISVSEVEHSPLWTNKIPSDGSMNDFIKDELKDVRSQDLESYFRLNGAIYIAKKDRLLREKTFFLKSNIFAYKMTKESSIDIDEKIDFALASIYMKERKDELK
jgi:CMP-N,N'-diacetyllegionaminic acid synthase